LVIALGTVLLISREVHAADAPIRKVRIVLAGDSTVTDKSGWGAAFARLLGPDTELINQASGGQSSKSFRDQGRWTKALDLKPDYVLIQFGHNDQSGKGPERETDPATTYRENLAYFIDSAREAGAIPIIVTSLTRRNFSPEGKIRTDELEKYAEAARAVAATKQAPLIDLYTRSVEQLSRLGPAGSQEFNPPHPKEAGQFDHTHLTPAGADKTAPLIVDELKRVVPALRECFLPTPAP
jgi:lysophospholipase L1-like esterase